MFSFKSTSFSENPRGEFAPVRSVLLLCLGRVFLLSQANVSSNERWQMIVLS